MPSPLHLVAHGAARRFIDLRLGWSLMRSPEVPVGKKVLAIAIGVGITGALLVFEVPLELFLGILLPLLGGVLDIAVDGIEVLLLPLLIALAVLPHLCRQASPPRLPEPSN